MTTKRLCLVLFTLVLLAGSTLATQNSNTAASQTRNTNAAAAPKRKPPFHATKDQIKQAQTVLKQRGFYNGELDSKLSPDTRAALKKYQEAEGLKVTGTLNAATLEKMSIPLTDKQKEMAQATK
jgi:peptidoglycan hydrolase-like protein with peptidoglycan-binding domain